MEEYDYDEDDSPYTLAALLDINRRSPKPYFSDIRILSLTQIRITTSMLAVTNFRILESLTLRLCTGGIGSLVEVFESGKFIYHQKSLPIYEDAEIEEDEGFHDVHDLAILPRVKKDLHDNPTENNPFSRLNLECLGLSCAPGKLLKLILEPFRTKQSLNLLHIRQSRETMRRYGSWGLDQADALRGLRIRFRRFLEWAFGPNGLPSLQVVAFGHFATSDGGSQGQHNGLIS
ncbi:hypothetical protein F5Y03DRAFT_379384 [Xylaria venustula]|nr:hypothetical protein F5Y03DRAFT_379384 [Xylaria venustula]